MGVVYQAFDPVVERHVAIKTIRFDNSGSAELLELLKREAKSVGRFEHPNIITLYDAGETEGLFYMVMQLVQGETLRDRMNRQRWYKVPQVVDVFRQILAGLGYAHERGVVHRDIKPANIMITSDGAIKLADFGIAKLLGPGTSSSGLLVGTPSYMSPEQVLGRPVDARSDLFSVGCTLYEVLTGEKAYPGDSATAVMYKIVHEAPARPATLRPGTDPGLEEVVLKALANDPDDRFPACRDMAKALEDCLARPFTRAPSAPGRVAVAPAVPPAPPSRSVSERLRQAPVPAGAGRRPKFLSARSIAGIAATVVIVAIIGVLSLAPRKAQVRPVERLLDKMTEVHPGQTVPAPAPDPVAPAPVFPTGTGVRPRDPAPLLRPPREPAPQFSPNTGAQFPHPPLRATTARVATNQSEDFNSLMLRGDEAFQQNAYDKALAAYLRANQLKPGNSAARRKLTVVLTLLGRTAEAQKYR